MPLDVTIDIAEMLADFGETWSVNGSSVVGILQDEYEAQTVYGLDVDSSAPMFTCATSDIAGVVRGDIMTQGTITYVRVTSNGDIRVTSTGDRRVVVAPGTAYKVHSLQDDGTGVTVLVLGKD